MKKTVMMSVLILLTGVSLASQQQHEQLRVQEKYKIALTNVSVELNEGKRMIDVIPEWTYKSKITAKQYVDYFDLTQAITSYLNDYPNPADWWESVNKNLSMFILGKYPSIQRLTIHIKVKPTDVNGIGSESTVTVSRGLLHHAKSAVRSYKTKHGQSSK